MLNKDLQFYAENAVWYESIHLYMRQQKGISTIAYAKPISMTTIRPDEAILQEPLLTMDRESAQSLMDALWTCGLRPSEGQGSAGQLAAVKYHLEDMRKLVFEGGRDEKD